MNSSFQNVQSKKIIKQDEEDEEEEKEEEKGNFKSQFFEIQFPNSYRLRKEKGRYQPQYCLLNFYYNVSALFDEKKCFICFDSMSKESKIILHKCHHSFHFQCLREYLRTRIDEKRFPIMCPMNSCLLQLLESEIIKNLEDIYQEKFYSFTLKHFVEMNKNQIFCCLSPDCEYFAFLDTQPSRYFQCCNCRQMYCMKCKELWHDNLTCEASRDQKEFAEVAFKNGYRQCISCHMFIEKNGGCSHMTCRCKNEFSWTGGK